MERRRGVLVLELGRGQAAQGGETPGDDHGEPVGAGVHHPGLAQHRQLLRSALDGLLARLERVLEHLGEQLVLLLGRGLGAQPLRVHVREVVCHAAGHRAHRGEHRPLRRVAHRRVRGVRRAGEGGGHEHRVHQLTGSRGELLGRAAYHLRQDHAAVAARPEQRGARHGAHDLVAPGRLERGVVQLRQLLDDRTHGERHVVAGVAVRDGEHVEVVDLLASVLELEQGSRNDPLEANQAVVGRHGDLFTPTGGSGGFRDLAGLEAARADVLAPGSAPDVDADLLEVRVEAALRRNHGMAAAVPERRALSARVTDLCHGRSG